MYHDLSLEEFLVNGQAYFLPSLSIDNVIFGFHDNELKVLLLQLTHNQLWELPGGFIYKDEEIDEAAIRILTMRTGLTNLFLQQFHVFGSTQRTRKELLIEGMPRLTDQSWLMNRFISIGYYALVDYEKVNPQPSELATVYGWHELTKIPKLIFDHRHIIEKALQAMRLQLNHLPIGYNLLPEEFTLKSLQTIYETILDRKLDRSNFSRKILGYNILDKKEKHYTGGAHKAPFLYSFNKEAYFNALETGLDKGF